jgi:hypothetical protein
MRSTRYLLYTLLLLTYLGVGAVVWRAEKRARDLGRQLLAAQDQAAHRAALAAAERVQLARRAALAEQRLANVLARDHQLEAMAHDLESRVVAAQRAAAAKPALAAQGNPSADAAGATPARSNQAGAVRLQMERRYGALIQRLALTPEKSRAFLQLLVDRQLAGTDAVMAAMQEGGGALGDPADLATLVAASQDDIDSQIHALLGDAGYLQYVQAGLTAGQTSTLTRLQAALSDTAPLSDGQLAQLQQIIANSHSGHLTSKAVMSIQSQGFLSAAQLQAVQNLFLQQRAAQQSRNAPLPPAPATGK